VKILIVKLSSLGDVVHTFPAVRDLQRVFPFAQIDWVVERSFAPLVSLSSAVHRVIPVDIRRWRKSIFSKQTHLEFKAFLCDLRENSYDAIIDLQGLSKSGLIARVAVKTDHGKRYAMANQTDGSGYESLTRWGADVCIALPNRIAAMDRSRLMCSRAFGYDIPSALEYGLKTNKTSTRSTVLLVHGTSRVDKEWPELNWINLAARLASQGFNVAFPYANTQEHERAERLIKQIPGAQLWPAMGLDALTLEMGRCAGVIGVDSGLSHIAVALDMPHVQIYNFDTAWRTGPQGLRRQRCVFEQPTPSVDTVFQQWLEVIQ
jgi:heptosyltransferase I